VKPLRLVADALKDVTALGDLILDTFRDAIHAETAVIFDDLQKQRADVEPK
jgi:hypothetical protein